MSNPVAFRCAECGAALGGHHWRVCVVCQRTFCRRHLIIAEDVATCASCRVASPEAKGRDEQP